jgi:hypothetical protein
MVKRDKGFNAATRDWEFFELDVSKDGTQIRKRGFADVVNSGPSRVRPGDNPAPSREDAEALRQLQRALTP